MVGWRKFLFGLWAFTLVWVFIMWAPAVTEGSRKEGMILLGSLAGLLAGSNAYEHRQRSKMATQGAADQPPPSGPGAPPAADTESAATPADGSPRTET